MRVRCVLCGVNVCRLVLVPLFTSGWPKYERNYNSWSTTNTEACYSDNDWSSIDLCCCLQFVRVSVGVTFMTLFNRCFKSCVRIREFVDVCENTELTLKESKKEARYKVEYGNNYTKTIEHSPWKVNSRSTSPEILSILLYRKFSLIGVFTSAHQVAVTWFRQTQSTTHIFDIHIYTALSCYLSPCLSSTVFLSDFLLKFLCIFHLPQDITGCFVQHVSELHLCNDSKHSKPEINLSMRDYKTLLPSRCQLV
jgi:hypothetical protein